MNDGEILDEMAKALLFYVKRVSESERATPAEYTALPEVARVLKEIAMG